MLPMTISRCSRHRLAAIISSLKLLTSCKKGCIDWTEKKLFQGLSAFSQASQLHFEWGTTGKFAYVWSGFYGQYTYYFSSRPSQKEMFCQLKANVLLFGHFFSLISLKLGPKPSRCSILKKKGIQRASSPAKREDIVRYPH